jgi:hypothetical protein
MTTQQTNPYNGHTLTIPPLGAYWPDQGGIYAGLIRGIEGQPDHHLIIATDPRADFDDAPWGEYGADIAGARSDLDGMTNTRAMAEAGNEAAQKILTLEIDGHADFHIPSIRDLSLARANVPEAFARDWYWSSTQYSADYAWCQDFDGGDQSSLGKDYELRARAVRRFSVIQ